MRKPLFKTLIVFIMATAMVALASETSQSHYGYAQGGIVVDGIAYFSASYHSQKPNKPKGYPFVVAFEAKPPSRRIATFKFEDTYDSTPMLIEVGGKKLLVAHEHNLSQSKAIDIKTGQVEWISGGQPGHYFFGYSYYKRQGDEKTIIGAFKNGLHALDAKTGKRIWLVRRISTGGPTPCVDQKRGVIYYQHCRAMTKIGAESGKVLKAIEVSRPNRTISWNVVLIDDEFGKYVATYWYGQSEWDSAIRVYDLDLKLIWQRSGLPTGKKATLTYYGGIITTGCGNGWGKYTGDRWKRLTGWRIADGTPAWTLDLSDHEMVAIYNLPCLDGRLHAETQGNGNINSKLFVIDVATGKILNIHEYGKPITSCATHILANGAVLSGDLYTDSVVVTPVKASKNDWPGPFGEPQTNQNSVRGNN